VTEAEPGAAGLRLLRLAAFLSTFDRFVVAPMLVTIAAALGAPLAEAALTASLYYLLYGLMQPAWGMLSDRLGRVRVMRLALLGALIGGLLSAAAPNLAALTAARALTGGFFAAVIPTSLVYIGDTVSVEDRPRELADLMAGTAVGLALAVVGAGVAASLGAWRLAFALPALSSPPARRCLPLDVEEIARHQGLGRGEARKTIGSKQSSLETLPRGGRFEPPVPPRAAFLGHEPRLPCSQVPCPSIGS